VKREEKNKTDKEKSVNGSERAEEAKYILRLYIAGKKRKSSKAIANLKRICEEHLAGRYELEVIDILEQPTLARDEQIVAVPALVKKLPDPLRKLIGDMSDKEKVLLGMDLRPKKKE
jgi:circadian clock protein KaiB